MNELVESGAHHPGLLYRSKANLVPGSLIFLPPLREQEDEGPWKWGWSRWRIHDDCTLNVKTRNSHKDFCLHYQEPLTKYSIPECKDPCFLDQFLELVNSLAVRDIASWCHACGNTQLSRCQLAASDCPTVRQPSVSGTGGFFLGVFVTLLMVIFITALWYFCLSKRCVVAGSGRRPRRGLVHMENCPDPGVIWKQWVAENL